jgi:hypothetical protein
MSSDHSTFKCYMGDTGLLVSLAFWDKKYQDNDLYRAILLDKMNVNEGMLADDGVSLKRIARPNRAVSTRQCLCRTFPKTSVVRNSPNSNTRPSSHERRKWFRLQENGGKTGTSRMPLSDCVGSPTLRAITGSQQTPSQPPVLRAASVKTRRAASCPA